MNDIAQHHNVLFVTLDSLRYDVADSLFRQNRTPNFQLHNPEGWQLCHSPGSFTYAAHQAFFAGFLPTPAADARAPRLFAARFAGSETTAAHTLVFDTPDIVSGLAGMGFRTICIGGVGFFNRQTPLGRILPSFFQECFWRPAFGVTDPDSTRHQFEQAASLIDERQTFLFINVSAIHQPNYFYADATTSAAEAATRQPDTLDSHAAALEYVDSQLPILFEALCASGRPTFCIVCSDHGTAYGENDYYGHRVGHPTVWEVPMATFTLTSAAGV